MGYKVKRIMIGDKQVRPYRYNPNANTVFYFPFSNDATDYSGNGYILSDNGTQQTIGRSFNTSVTTNKNSEGTFVNMRVKINSIGSGGSGKYDQIVVGLCSGSMNYQIVNTDGNSDLVSYWYGSQQWGKYKLNLSVGQWYNIGWFYNNNSGYYILNGVKGQIASGTPYNWGSTSNQVIYMSTNTHSNITLSELIFENAIWSDQQILDYYNKTKSNYGL